MSTSIEPQTHTTEHTITASAPPEAVFELIANATRWPEIFTPTIHVERLAHNDTDERLQIWALANEEPKAWTSSRRIDRTNRSISFRQDVSSAPVRSMGGEWLMEAQPDGTTLVRLLHDFTAVGDDPDNVRWISEATDKNSRAELGRLKAVAELGDQLDALTVSFDDTVPITGAVEDAYEFISDAARWPERLPHVARLDMQEPTTNIQLMEMDTSTSDGSVHTTKSYRICFPNEKIAYKQVTLPKLMQAHTGCWFFTRTADGLDITSRHTVIIEPSTVTEVLGPEATVAQARDFVQKALMQNSRITMDHTKAFAEARREA